MDYFVIHVKSCQNSKFDGEPFYEIEIVGIDAAKGINGCFKSYIVTTYNNFPHWEEILNMKTSKHAVWFSGDMKIKGNERHIEIINADSKPNYIDVVSMNALEQYVLQLVDDGVFTLNTNQKQLSDVGKQFFMMN